MTETLFLHNEAPRDQVRSREGKEELGRKILVAEDDPALMRLAVRTLEDMGYEVVTAINGEELLDKVDSENPDAILSDIRMPKMDGVQALTHMRENPKSKLVPVIVYSATWTPELEDKVQELGGKLLNKPLNPDKLREQLDDIFGKSN